MSRPTPSGAGALQWLHRRRHPVLVALVVIAVGLRLFRTLVSPGYQPTRDFENGIIARSLVAGQGYSMDGKPTAHKAPLYPLFLAACYYAVPDEQLPVPEHVDGYEVRRDRTHRLVLLIQSIVSALIVLPIYLIARRAFGFVHGICAATVYVVNIPLLHHHLHIERNTFDMLLASLFVYGFLEMARRPSARAIAISGISSALALLSNGAMAAPIFLCQIWSVAAGSEKSLRHRLVQQGAVYAVIAVLLSPWIIRNYATFNKVIPFTSNFGLELFLGNNPRATGGHFDASLTPVTTLPEDVQSAVSGMDEVAKYKYLQQLAVQYIIDNPLAAAKLRMNSFVQFWVGEIHWSSFRNNPNRRKHFIADTIFVLLAVAGIVMTRRGRHVRWYFVAFLLGACAPYVMTHAGGDRYRALTGPVLTICMTVFLICAVRRLLPRPGGRSHEISGREVAQRSSL